MTVAEHDQIPEAALGWIDAGKRAVLATVVETWGSAPRPAGSQLAISSEAELVGSVSGGCVEGAVVAEALDAVEDGECRVLEFGVSDDEAFAVGLACGGRIRVMVEPIGIGRGPDVALIRQLVAERAARHAVGYVVCTESWDRLLIDQAAGTPIGAAVRRAMVLDRSGFEEVEGAPWFIGVHNPPLRLIVVGAVHIAQPLVKMARLAGYDVSLVDPREAFASDARFPGETILNDWPDAALDRLGLDARTAVVTLTHDPKLDDPAILRALDSDVFYLGSLGSTRTHAKRVTRLTEAGVPEGRITRIHAPVGLDIGARAPAEIAVSILAEMTERLRRPATRPSGEAARPFVSALVLAAGLSGRMGDVDKLTEPVEHAPLIRRSAAAAEMSRADEVLVIVGPEDDPRTGPRLAALMGGARVVHNPENDEGMASSIRAGLTAIDPRADAVLVMPADMPLLGADHIDAVIGAFDPEAEKSICRAVDEQGRPGHPVLFGRRYFDALSEIEGDQGARAVIEAHRDQLAEVTTLGQGAILDLDTPEDWSAFNSRRGG